MKTLRFGILILMAWSMLPACTNKDYVGQGVSAIAGGGSQGSNGGPQPIASPTPDSTPTGPQAHVFNKNPTYAGATGYYTLVNSNPYSSSPAWMNYDSLFTTVTLNGTTNGFLENSTIKILTDELNLSTGAFQSSGRARAQADASGNWFFSTMNDTNRKVGQLMAFYWLGFMADKMESVISGGAYFRNKNTPVYSQCYKASSQAPGINAFWSGSMVCMSYIGGWESAHDASVYVHEMGHGNIDYATNFAFAAGRGSEVNQYQCGNNLCCSSADGCPGALNEGQADFHAQVVFNSGAVGEYFTEIITGQTTGLPNRDSEKNTNLTGTQMFSSISPEIHSMGAVWSASWWTLRKNIGVDAEKIFLASLITMNTRDTYRGALTKVLTAESQLFTQGKISVDQTAAIKAAFSQHGIIPQ